jgi:hypothetical protein
MRYLEGIVYVAAIITEPARRQPVNGAEIAHRGPDVVGMGIEWNVFAN